MHIYQNTLCKSIVSHSDSQYKRPILFCFNRHFFFFFCFVFFSYLNRQVCNGMNRMRIDSIRIWKYENVNCIFSLPAYTCVYQTNNALHFIHFICMLYEFEYDIFKWIENNQEQHFVFVLVIYLQQNKL